MQELSNSQYAAHEVEAANCSKKFPLGIEKPKEGLIVFIPESGANAHMPGDRSGDTRRKPFRRVMATGTILIEYLLSPIWIDGASIRRVSALLPLRRCVLRLRDDCGYS